jgi:hypothetical protein
MHRFHDACILRLACAGQDMREYFFVEEFNCFLMGNYFFCWLFFLIADSRDCCSHLCEERLQPSDNFEEKELQNKMKEWGRTLKWAGRGFVWRPRRLSLSGMLWYVALFGVRHLVLGDKKEFKRRRRKLKCFLSLVFSSKGYAFGMDTDEHFRRRLSAFRQRYLQHIDLGDCGGKTQESQETGGKQLCNCPIMLQEEEYHRWSIDPKAITLQHVYRI